MPLEEDDFERALAVMVERLSEPDFLRSTRMLITILHNLYKFPEKEKYRKLKTGNEVIRSIVLLTGVHDCLGAMGFSSQLEGNAYVLQEALSKSELETCLDRMVQGKPAPLDQRKKMGVMEAWELFPQDLELGATLGGGKFGKVYEGLWNGTKVAIKTMRKKNDEKALADFHREAAVMTELQHPNVILLLGVVLKQQPPLLIMELMGACFLDLLKQCQLSEKDVLDCAMQIAAGLEYIHFKGYIHCDIACRNVLVANTGRLVIGDLGLARKCNSSECDLRGTKAKFPIRWTAPEVFQDQMLSRQSDVWSFGVTFWEIVTQGGTPYEGLSNKEAKRAVKEGLRPSRPEGCPESLYNIMRQCWQNPPQLRPQFADIVHELLSLKINLAHSGTTQHAVKEVSVSSKKTRGWFLQGRRRSRDRHSRSSAEMPDVAISAPVAAQDPKQPLPTVFRVFTSLVTQTKTHVTIKINYADRASKVKQIIMRKVGIADADGDDYCLVEVGSNGVYSRIIAPEEYPLSITASPFFDQMLHVYLCTAYQAEDVHACLQTLRQEELALYRDALAKYAPKRKPREDLDFVGGSAEEHHLGSRHSTRQLQLAEPLRPAGLLDTALGDLGHEEDGEEEEDDTWLVQAEETGPVATPPGGVQSGSFSSSIRRRKLKSTRSLVYDRFALDGDDQGEQEESQQTRMHDALYESDHDLDDEPESRLREGDEETVSVSASPRSRTTNSRRLAKVMRTLKRDEGNAEVDPSSPASELAVPKLEQTASHAGRHATAETGAHPRSLLARRASSGAGASVVPATVSPSGAVSSSRPKSHLEVPQRPTQQRLSASSDTHEALVEAVTFVVAPTVSSGSAPSSKATSAYTAEAKLRPQSPGALPARQKPDLQLDLSQINAPSLRGAGMPSPLGKAPISATLLHEASQLDLAETTDEGPTEPRISASSVGPATSTPQLRRPSHELLAASSEAAARRRQASPTRSGTHDGSKPEPMESQGRWGASQPTSSKRVSVASSVDSIGSQGSGQSKPRLVSTGTGQDAKRPPLGRIPERPTAPEARGPHHGVPSVVTNPAGTDDDAVLAVDGLDDMDRLAVLMGISPASKTSTAKSTRELELDWDAVEAEGSDDEVEI